MHNHVINKNWGIQIKAASRLSFTLIDLNGESGRRNGMASLSLADPYFQASAFPNDITYLELDKNSSLYRSDIENFLRKLQKDLDLPPVYIKVNKGLPIHSGFGSKTTTLLALGKIYTKLYNVNTSTERLAQLGKRGRTSGASVNLIDRGGFLVDGGHSNPVDFNDNPYKYLRPSHHAQNSHKPPVLINLKFPDWPILIIITNGIKLSGDNELNWFKTNFPMPREEAQKTAHHILMNLSTAIAEENYPNFCKALNSITYEHYSKKRQIDIQPKEVQNMFKEAKTREDIDAIALSVTGPMCFAFTQKPNESVKWCQKLQKEGVIKKFWFSYAQNRACDFNGVVNINKNLAET